MSALGRSDVIVRYADLSDPADRFSDVTANTHDVHFDHPAAFPQRPGSLNALLGGANGELPQRDDAFQLRVQSPEGAVGAPVVVFIPGGGFMTGAGGVRWFSAPSLVDGAGVVLVTVTYRVGALGHLGPDDDPTHSQRGLRDILQALKWVSARIGDFGGDPANVTLAGDSAGAWYAFALSCMSETVGLFARAALISLPREAPLTRDAYRERRAAVADALGGPLEDAAADEVLDVQAALARAYLGSGMVLMPAAGGPVPADLHEFAVSVRRLHVDSLLLLSTSEEAAAFLFSAPDAAFRAEAVEAFLSARFDDAAAVAAWIQDKRPGATPKEQMIEALTLHQFRLAHLELAAAAYEAGVSAFVAGFSIQSPLAGAYSPHCFPLPFLFGERAAWHDAPMLTGLDSDVFDSTAAALQEWFVGFVRNGTPTVAGAAVPAYAPDLPTRLEFDGSTVAVRVPSERGLRAR